MEKVWTNGAEGHNSKYKRETLLNYGMNRWGLNKASSVGATSELIRECAPSSYEDWVEFYFNEAVQKKKRGIKITQEYLRTLGEELYMRLSENVQSELASITEEECVDYVYNLVINRTYEGYVTEIETIYGQLTKILGYPIESAPDQWDRTFGVDFYISIQDYYIGIQIKPVSTRMSINQYQWIEQNRNNHHRFTEKYKGKVFFVFSKKNSAGKKQIDNIEVIEEIKAEIERLKHL
ncbi:MjaI family restriction endonuclease [Mediterranea massiliensis]|uniref:MjaI family restriction endonuclease n=1 Tax=Mediterranea massiliensis TaxID=1841865 RepID=UPI000934C10E|nr:MjaI family restriction endonuclease [Mediterranea massiliensis]